jgi:hypothetical protein
VDKQTNTDGASRAHNHNSGRSLALGIKGGKYKFERSFFWAMEPPIPARILTSVKPE